MIGNLIKRKSLWKAENLPVYYLLSLTRLAFPKTNLVTVSSLCGFEMLYLIVHSDEIVLLHGAVGLSSEDFESFFFFFTAIPVKVARNEVENASFAQRSAHRDSRIWRPELIEPAAERKRRARADDDRRSNRPTPTHRFCHSAIFCPITPYNVWFFWVSRHKSIILAKKMETFSGRFWEIPGNENMATGIDWTGRRAQATRARGRWPTFKSAYPDPQILPQCNILSNYPL